MYLLGDNSIEADAALAYNKALMALNMDHTRHKNFSSFKDYQEARRIEIESRIDINDLHSLEEVGKEIDEIVAKKFSNASIRVAAARESARPKSAFIGTSRNGSKWKARRGFKGTQYPVRTYILEADAAFAYDCAVEWLWDNNGIIKELVQTSLSLSMKWFLKSIVIVGGCQPHSIMSSRVSAASNATISLQCTNKISINCVQRPRST